MLRYIPIVTPRQCHSNERINCFCMLGMFFSSTDIFQHHFFQNLYLKPLDPDHALSGQFAKIISREQNPLLAGKKLSYTMACPPRGYSHVTSYVGPPSTSHPKKIGNFKHPHKIFEILATQKISPILYPPYRNDPKMIRNDP